MGKGESGYGSEIMCLDMEMTRDRVMMINIINLQNQNLPRRQKSEHTCEEFPRLGWTQALSVTESWNAAGESKQSVNIQIPLFSNSMCAGTSGLQSIAPISSQWCTLLSNCMPK